MFDPTKVKSRLIYKAPTAFYSVSTDPVTGKVYAGADDYAVYVFDPASEKKEAVARWTKHDNYVAAVACVNRPGQHLVVSGSYDRSLVWWDADTGQVVRSVDAHQGWVRDLVATPDGSRLVSAGDDMLVKVWETDTGRLVHTLEGHAKRTPQGHVTALYTVAVSPDGKYVASGDRIGDVRVWELETGKQVQNFQVPVLYTYDPVQRKRSIGGIRTVAFSRDGNLLAVGGVGQIGNVDGIAGPATVEVWDWRQPRLRLVGGAQGHKGMINHVLFLADGAWLLGAGGGSDNGFLAFWKVDALPAEATPGKRDDGAGQRLKGDGHVHKLALNAAGTEVYAAGHQKVEVWTLGA